MKVIIYFLSAIVCCGQLPPEFVKALHQVESDGRYGAVKGDYDNKSKTYKSLGPFQIQRGYFEDAKKFDKANLGGYKYEDVKRYDVSVKTMDAYMRRYEPQAYRKKNLEALARLHNAGPEWKNKVRASDGYWNKVKSRISVK